MGGFPTWTLWGMGLSALGALIAITLALIAQTPRLLARFNLARQRFDLRARAFTGYGLALLLLAFGFFIAGVPLDGGEAAAGEDGVAAEATPDELAVAGTIAFTVTETPTPGPGAAGVGATLQEEATRQSGSGAMVGLATSTPGVEVGAVLTGTVEVNVPPGADTGVATAEPPPPATPEPTATPSPIPSATPTPTPSPTLTPTPISGPTAQVNDETSTLPVRRLPGGQILVVLARGDTVLLLPGHAFHSGRVWREISTVNGVVGWVVDEYLAYATAAQ